MSQGQNTSPRRPTIVTSLQDHALRSSGKVACIFTDGDREQERLTYAELDARARSCAGGLQARMPRGSRVLLMLPQGRDYVIALLGCFYAGMVAVPSFPPRRGRDAKRVRRLWQDAEPALALTAASAYTADLPAAETLAELTGSWVAVDLQQSDLAFLQYTSGSTSEPRGVMVSHGSLLANEQAIQHAFRIFQQSVVASWLPFFHDMGLVGGLLQPLFVGATAVLMPPVSFAQEPLRWLRTIDRYRATISGGPNFAFQRCVEQAEALRYTPLDLSCWETAFTGAEPVRATTLRQFTAALRPYGFRPSAWLPCYGLAESTLLVTAGRVPALEGLNVVSCGQPPNDTELLIVDPERCEHTAAGETGEIWIASPSVAQGYWRRPEESARSFHAQISGSSQQTYLRTGDLGILDADGLRIVGRIKDLLIHDGRNYHAKDLELAAEEAHGDVLAGGAAAFAVDDDEAVALALEVPRHGRSALREIAAAVSAALRAEFEWAPSLLVLTPPLALPRTSSGKLRRAECRRQLLADELKVLAHFTEEELQVQPSSQTHALSTLEWLRQAIATTLQVEAGSIPEEISLAGLGLGSMQIVHLLHRLQAEQGVTLSLADALSAPTLEVLAQGAAPALAAAEEVTQQQNALPAGQLSLYLEQTLHPEAATCNVSGVMTVEGTFDLHRWHDAWTAVMRQTPSLRIEVREENGTPRLQESGVCDAPVEWTDATRWTEPHLYRELRRLAQAPIPMETAPLWGVHIFSHAADRHTVLLRFHHILLDLWSVALLWERFLHAYAQADFRTEEARIVTAAHPRQGGVAAQASAAEESHAGVTNATAGAPQLGIRTSERPSLRGERLLLRLPFAERVRRCGVEIAATPAAVLLAAFQIVLSRYSAQKVFRVALPYSGRETPQDADEVGYFVRLLPVGADLRGNPSFTQVAKDAQAATLIAIAGLRQAQASTDAAEIAFVFQDLSHTHHAEVLPFLLGFGGAQWTAKDMQLSSVDWDPGIAQRDLTCTLGLHGQELLLAVEYDEARFARGDVRRLAADFLQVVEDACAAPAKCLHLFTLPSATVPVTPASLPQQVTSLAHAFELQAERTPEAIALVDGTRRYSYRELNLTANRLAHRLLVHGAAPEARIAILAARSVRYLIAILAVTKTGAAYAPLDADAPPERIAGILDDLQPCLLLTEIALEQPGKVSQPVLYLDMEEDGPDSNPPRAASLDNLAYIIFTSGSTGRPKGCMVTHRNVLRLFEATRARFAFSAGDCWSLFHSLAFDFSVWEMWGAWLSSGRVVLLSHEETRSPAATVDILRREGVTLFSQTPSAFRQLLATVGADVAASLPQLRFVVFGGESLDFSHLRDWFRYTPPHVQAINMYGITETTVHVTERPVLPEDAVSTRSLIGAPLKDLEVLLLDDDLQPTPAGVPGEMYVSGSGVCRGYLHQPLLTAERFLPNPYGREPGERMYRTGDLARRTPSGDLQYLGRNDSQVQFHGYRIELGDVESALAELPGVQQAVVVVRDVAISATPTAFQGGEEGVICILPFRRYLKQNRTGGTPQEGSVGPDSAANQTHVPQVATEPQIIAYVVASDADIPGWPECLREDLLQKLPRYMLPNRIVRVAALPLTATGKVDRKALPGPAVTDANMRPFSPPQTPAEQALCRIWKTVLHQPVVGIDDNYFALGGDSIRGIRCVAMAASAGLSITLPVLYAHPTVRQLAGALAPVTNEVQPHEQVPFALVDPQERPLLPLGLDDAYPMSRMQAGLLFHSDQHEATSVYRASFLYRIEARCDGAAFVAAVQQIVAHYPILRTSFDLLRCREPMQLVWSQVDTPVSVLDLRHCTPEEQDAVAEAWFQNERLRDFAIETAPLIRFSMHMLSDTDFTLGLTCHDAILDGWSTASVLVQLLQCYGEQLRGERAVLPVQTLTYRDFVTAEREALASPQSKEFWRALLEGLTPGRLPIWDAPEALGAPSMAVVDVPVSRQMSEDLLRLAQRMGVSLKSVLLAAHLCVLQLLTGSHDVVTGLEANGRPEQDGSELTVGQHLNTVPFRLCLSAATWSGLIQDVARAENDMLPHRRFPYADIQRMHGGAGLYDTTFNYTHFHVFSDLDGTPGVRVLEGHGRELTHYLLKTEFNRDADTGKLNLDVIFDRGRMGDAQASYIGELYRTVLRTVAADADGQVDAMKAPPLPEQWDVQAFGIGSVVPRAAGTLIDLLEEQAERSPEHIAVRFGTEQWTYRELHRCAGCIAEALRQQGVGPECVVALHMEQCLELVAAYLGIWKVGGVPLLLAADAPTERLATILQDARPLLVLTEEWVAATLREYREPLPPGSHGCIPGNGAYLLYTSGSTGTPKGVLNTHAGLLNRILWMQEAYQFRADDRVLQKTPVSFDVSVWEFCWPLIAGATLVLAEPGGHRDPAYLMECMEREGITTVHFVPSMLSVFLQAAKPGRVPRLRRTLVSGEALTPALVAAFARTLPGELHNLYGPTEAAIDVTAQAISTDAEGPVSIGKPIANVRTYILGSGMRHSLFGAEGELYLAGPCLSRGYLGQPGLTAERFVPDPFSVKAGERMYRTGDRARYVANGELQFLGRTDAQLKINGVRMEPAEIEAALERHPAIAQAAVFASTDASGRALLASCYTVCAGATEPTVDVLRGFLLPLLPSPMVPSRWTRMECLPTGATGKLDRLALQGLTPASLPEEGGLEALLRQVEALTEVEAQELVAGGVQ